MSTAAEQRISNLIRIGTVTDVKGALCRVQVGDMVTDYLQWLVPYAGQVIVWNRPSIGEQVAVLCGDGDLANGIVLRGLYSNAFPAPSDSESLTLIRFADGAQISYDSAAHALAATLPNGGTAQVTASGGITLNADVTVNGLLTVNGDAKVSGTVTADTDVLGAGISLKSHKHSAVQPGNGTSGPPA